MTPLLMQMEILLNMFTVAPTVRMCNKVRYDNTMKRVK